MINPTHFIALVVFALLLASFAMPPRLSAQVPDPVAAARQFIAEHEASIRPLEIASAKASWNADITGKGEDYQAKEQAQNRLDAALADASRFARLKQIRQSLQGTQADPLLLRQVELFYLQYLEKQLDRALLQTMAARSTAAVQAFNTYRAKVNGQELTASQVAKVLKESKDSAYRQQVWEASKAVGAVVQADLKELVKLRNQAARKLGFANYYEMQLQLSELQPQQVLKLFDELHELTHAPFLASKAAIDAKLARDYGIAPEQLRPWHYQDLFFQEAPAVHNVDFDTFYAKADVLKLCRDFYASIGLPVEAILARSDLYEKPGKYPHAQCSDLDLEGDVRVMANIVPNEYWVGTMLHELGHAVYSTPNIPLSLPYVLRSPAHIFTTEGIAMMFERCSRQAGWMSALGLSVADPKAVDEAGLRMIRDDVLIFAAWSQVMVRFEAAMYANPDQDLNKLWWDLVEKYQGIRRPEGRNAPDYAAKIHIVSAPAYYHGYMMGRMFASQLHRTIATDVLKTDPRSALYNNRKDVGQFLQTKVFAPGRTLRWDAMVRFATGQDLNAKALAEEIAQ